MFAILQKVLDVFDVGDDGSVATILLTCSCTISLTCLGGRTGPFEFAPASEGVC